MSTTKRIIGFGDCDCCTKTDVNLYAGMAGMSQCEACLALDQSAKSVKVIEMSRKVDTLIELKQDVFLAGTVSFAELQSAIQHNDSIPDNQKNYAIVAECDARLQILQKAIFDDEAALVAKKNEYHALRVNAQNVAARLTESERAKYKHFDVNYKPNAPTKKEKSIKPVNVTKAPKYSKTELIAASKKYGIPMQDIQFCAQKRHLSADAAGRELAELMGLLQPGM